MSGKKPYTYSSRIRFTHTDPAGYVFFPRFFEKFQAAVEDWFNLELAVDYAGLVLNRGLGLPTAHTECTFIKPCLLGEMLDLSLRLIRVGNTSLTVEFIGSVAGKQRLRARSILVFIRLKDGTPVPIPADLRGKFEDYQAQS
ncbi:MAG: acyl-CoA thioesterase [Deltaproteobacteria bacterium]|nr:acyl-CoA thioesterase [Deltaproteobacteria bacterium]